MGSRSNDEQGMLNDEGKGSRTITSTFNIPSFSFPLQASLSIQLPVTAIPVYDGTAGVRSRAFATRVP